MKHEHSIIASSLRAASLAIVLVSLVALSTIVYSIYTDYNGAIGVVGKNQAAPTVSAKTVVQGMTAKTYLNVTIPNRGLYTIRVVLSCLSNISSGVTCANASVTVPPGGEQTLHFVLTTQDFDQQGAVPAGVKANLSLSLIPFASLNIVVDLSSLVEENG